MRALVWTALAACAGCDSSGTTVVTPSAGTGSDAIEIRVNVSFSSVAGEPARDQGTLSVYVEDVRDATKTKPISRASVLVEPIGGDSFFLAEQGFVGEYQATRSVEWAPGFKISVTTSLGSWRDIVIASPSRHALTFEPSARAGAGTAIRWTPNHEADTLATASLVGGGRDAPGWGGTGPMTDPGVAFVPAVALPTPGDYWAAVARVRALDAPNLRGEVRVAVGAKLSVK